MVLVSYYARHLLFTVDRVFPLPEGTRRDPIDVYLDEDPSNQKEAKGDKDRKDCLARVYLEEK